MGMNGTKGNTGWGMRKGRGEGVKVDMDSRCFFFTFLLVVVTFSCSD